jgi:hypothetical protein
MSVELTHAAIAATYLTTWFLIGQLTRRRRTIVTACSAPPSSLPGAPALLETPCMNQRFGGAASRTTAP